MDSQRVTQILGTLSDVGTRRTALAALATGAMALPTTSIPARAKRKSKGAKAEKKRKKPKAGSTVAIVLADEVTFSIPNTPGGAGNAEISRCPAGTTPVGGSAFVDNPACRLIASGLSGDGGWTGAGACPGGEESNGAVRAICLRIS